MLEQVMRDRSCWARLVRAHRPCRSSAAARPSDPRSGGRRQVAPDVSSRAARRLPARREVGDGRRRIVARCEFCAHLALGRSHARGGTPSLHDGGTLRLRGSFGSLLKTDRKPAVLLGAVAGRAFFLLLAVLFESVAPFTVETVLSQIETGLSGLVLQAAMVPLLVMGLRAHIQRERE